MSSAQTLCHWVVLSERLSEQQEDVIVCGYLSVLHHY